VGYFGGEQVKRGGKGRERSLEESSFKGLYFSSTGFWKCRSGFGMGFLLFVDDSWRFSTFNLAMITDAK
jgi:hypothetical protein